MFCLKDEHERDLVNSVFLYKFEIALIHDCFTIFDSNHVQCVVQVSLRYDLHSKNIVRVEDGFEIFLL